MITSRSEGGYPKQVRNLSALFLMLAALKFISREYSDDATL